MAESTGSTPRADQKRADAKPPSLRQLLWQRLHAIRNRLQPGRLLRDLISINEERARVTGLTAYHRIQDAENIPVESAYHRRFVEATPEYADFCCERKPIFTAELNRVKFHSGTGLIATQDDKIIVESAALDWRIRKNRVMNTPKPKVAYRPPPGGNASANGRHTTIWGLLAHNYFHWMVECLPRIHSLAMHSERTGEPLTFVLPDDVQPFHRTSLEYCLPPGARIESVPANVWTGFESFVMPSYVTTWYLAAVPRPHLDYVRGKIFERVGVMVNPQPEVNLFISRRNAGDRRIVNEEALIERLQPYGFEVVTPEDLSFDEQVRLFQRARIIVAAHGAGLSNILFAPEKAKVVELSFANPRPYFYFLARSLGQDFHYVLGDPGAYKDDLTVDLDAVEREIAPLLETSAPPDTPSDNSGGL